MRDHKRINNKKKCGQRSTKVIKCLKKGGMFPEESGKGIAEQVKRLVLDKSRNPFSVIKKMLK